ncbi:MAG: M56 family metallopeptidase [Hydrococcus sp. Prado102]|jgi:Zn-dependent protease with chaperone function|nr:M56 family metallopeptidase [Hydrococcus sp. Prado102]
MHAVMIFFALILALSLRIIPFKTTETWQNRWQTTLFFFLFPPLLLLMTAIAVSCMGYRGAMFGWQVGLFGYILAISFIVFASILLIKLFEQAWRSQQKIKSSTQQIVEGKIARVLDITFPYSAQIGFWKSELILTQGMLNVLDPEHLKAVLAHEQAHYDNRDTFWFFWLGWVRSFTAWLPKTESLWQELLLLRELRADRQAIQQVDSLLLAESLLLVTQKASQFPFSNIPQSFCAALNETIYQNRLEERIELILSENNSSFDGIGWSWSWIILLFLPLITVPLHY